MDFIHFELNRDKILGDKGTKIDTFWSEIGLEF